MHLREYMFRKDISHSAFAKLIGISNSHFSLILNGKQRMHPNTALKIEQLTNGLVTRDEVLFPEKHPDWRLIEENDQPKEI